MKWVVLVGVLVAGGAWGAPITTWGDQRCADWGPDAEQVRWILGYLSGLNHMAVVADRVDVLAKSPTDRVMPWLRDYCREHPDDYMGEGVTDWFLLQAGLGPAPPTSAPR